MQLVEVDHIGLQPPQRGVAGPPHIPGPAVGHDVLIAAPAARTWWTRRRPARRSFSTRPTSSSLVNGPVHVGGVQQRRALRPARACTARSDSSPRCREALYAQLIGMHPRPDRPHVERRRADRPALHLAVTPPSCRAPQTNLCTHRDPSPYASRHDHGPPARVASHSRRTRSRDSRRASNYRFWDGDQDFPADPGRLRLLRRPVHEGPVELAVRPLPRHDAASGSSRPSPPASTTSLPGLGHLRPGVRLCNARGVHEASTAELALALILASLRGIPGFVRGQDNEEWRAGFCPGARRQVRADRRVRLDRRRHRGPARALRVRAGGARRALRAHHGARPGARRSTELPALLPEADVVVLVHAAHRPDQRAWWTPSSWPR